MKTIRPGVIFLTDYYKHSHSQMYFPGTKRISSYGESRGSSLPFADSTVFFGMQYFISEYLLGQVINMQDIDLMDEMCEDVFGNKNVFNREMWVHIVEKYDGHLPLTIRAVREGTKVPVKNVLFDITCHDEKCVSLTNFVETLLQNIWYPTTVSTLSYYIKQLVKEYWNETVDDENHGGIPFVLNDFGARGVSSPEEAMLGGMGHLINFMGSDNVPAHWASKMYYKAEKGKTVGTVPATEHSVMTLLGKEGEVKVYAHCMNVYPTGLLSMVSDGFSIINAVKNIFGNELHDKVVNREGTIVIRLDSGNPKATIITVLNILFEKFGFTVNSKGYKVLPPYIRIMQADGVDYYSINEIYLMLSNKKISAENIVFGMGGALLRKVNRDTFKFAVKCSYAMITDENGNTKEIDVQKSPEEIDENFEVHQSFKKSKSGLLKLIKFENEYMTVRQDDLKTIDYTDELITVFENGKLMNFQTFEEIKARLNEQV